MNPWHRIVALGLVAGASFLTAAEVTCASAESMTGLMDTWTAGHNALHPEAPARVTLRARYSADFVDALARGEVKVAPFAREMFEEERRRFLELTGGMARLVPVAIGSRATKGGTHAIAIFVHEKNPLTQLSLEQLREIWSRDGRITTWGQLGLAGEWAERRITLHGMRVRRETGNPPGIVNYLETRLLAGRTWREGVHQHTDITGGPQSLEQIVRAVGTDEAAMGYSGFAYAAPGAKPVAVAETDAGPFHAGTPEEIAQGTYPLTRTLYLCTSAAPDAATTEFLRYVLGPEGQAAITTDPHGFFPLDESTADALLPPYEPQVAKFPTAASYVTPAGAISIIGYNDMAEMLEAVNEAFVARHPGFKFALTLKGTRTAPPALARGESAFAPMGAEFSPRQLEAYRAQAGHEPRVFRVAHCSLRPQALSGPLAIMVHKDNPMTSLNLAEIADIFSGRAPRGLTPAGLEPELALALFFRDRVLGGDGFPADFKGFKQSADVARFVAGHPAAVGFAAAMRSVPGVRMLPLARTAGVEPVELTEGNIRAGRYPLDRFLLIYAREPLEPWIREYLSFVLSREGQGIVARSTLGYLPLNAAELAAERLRLD